MVWTALKWLNYDLLAGFVTMDSNARVRQHVENLLTR